MPRHIVGVLRIDTGRTTGHSDAEFGSMARKICREIKVQQFISEWVAVRGVGGRKGPGQILREFLFENFILSAPFRDPCRIGAVLYT